MARKRTGGRPGPKGRTGTRHVGAVVCGRRRVGGDPLRLRQDALALALATIFPKNSPTNIGRLTNRLADPHAIGAVDLVKRIDGSYWQMSIEALPMEVGRSPLVNMDRYTAKRISANSDIPYVGDDGNFVEKTSRLVFFVIITRSKLVAEVFAKCLLDEWAWPRGSARNILKFAAHLHRTDPGYAGPDRAIECGAEMAEWLQRTRGEEFISVATRLDM